MIREVINLGKPTLYDVDKQIKYMKEHHYNVVNYRERALMDLKVPKIKEYRNTLNNKSGVYGLIDYAGKLVYVGKTGNFAKRLGYSHMKLYKHIEEIEYIAIYECSNINLIEALLIKELNPKYNSIEEKKLANKVLTHNKINDEIKNDILNKFNKLINMKVR